ncbi:hypothetical protein NB721_000100 [Xanthomonas sacchari]|nr:hypothetical protein [Xanthomonas sacchari]MCW0451014.1 hypothetical protein [Xanthomonas sacchari]
MKSDGSEPRLSPCETDVSAISLAASHPDGSTNSPHHDQPINPQSRLPNPGFY